MVIMADISVSQRGLSYIAAIESIGSDEDLEKLRRAYNDKRRLMPGSGLTHDVSALLSVAEESVSPD